MIEYYTVESVTYQILCITADPALRRVLSRTLGPLGCTVVMTGSVESILDLPDLTPQLLIVDLTCEDVEKVQPNLRARAWTPRILALASWSEQAEALTMLDLCQCENLMDRSESLDEAELLATALKLLEAQNIFGVDKYLAWGVKLREITVRSYDEKRAAIELVTRFASQAGCRRRLLGKVEIVLDELLMNAMYDAPASRGVERSMLRSRAIPGGGPIGDLPVRLSFGCDGRFLALSVQDAYGALERQTVIDHLTRAVTFAGTPLTSSEGGAGLGLYFILSSVSRFVANIQPGQATEVICLFDLRPSVRQAPQVATSFHIFSTSERHVPPLSAAS